MTPFLSDYIFSIASKSREKVQNILSAAQVSKEDLDDIASRIENISQRIPIIVRPEVYGSIISNITLDGVHRDVDSRMLELFNESNLISLLLDTHSEILSSEVKRHRDQLDSFEKYINNYSFMLADQGFYDYAYTEAFSNDIQKEKGDFINTMLYDRSGIGFDPLLEISDVDQGAGILTMSASFIASYPLFALILRSNCASFETSNSGIDRSISDDVSQGWRVAVSSPRPISSSIVDSDPKGAQYELEYVLSSPAPCDTFSITPMSDAVMDILSIKIYGEDFSQYKEILADKKALDKNQIFYFEQDIVSKVVIIVNQPLYTRGKLPPSQSERQYKNVVELQRSYSPLESRTKINSNKAFHRLFNKWFLKTEKKRAALRRPQANIDKYLPAGIDKKDALSYQKETFRTYSLFDLGDRRRNIFNRWLIEKLFKHQPELLERFTLEEKAYNHSPKEIPYIISDEILDDNVDPINYEYTLGIRNIKIGLTVDKNRSLFISKPVPAPVQAGEVRIQVDETNFKVANSYLDNSQATTIEYSVTNKSNPSSDKDWVPIIPATQKGSEIVERLFVQSSGFGSMRFRAGNDEGISLFKNGKKIDLSLTSIIRSNDKLSIIGVMIPRSEFSMNADDVYLVSYVPIGDPTTVNFGDKGFQQKNIASSFDDNGAGELFSRTGNSNSVTLSNYPYVDYIKVENESSYSTIYGLTGSYQPIKVVLADGTIAYNYTNYTGIRQNLLASGDIHPAFLHSGKQITFNQIIDQDFRVYYQYEPSYLRYRVIFRVIGQSKISPFVNSLTIKMKMNSSILGINNKRV